MSNLFKRILSIALALLLVLSYFPAGKAFAEEGEKTEINARFFVALSSDMGNRNVTNYEFLFDGKVIYGTNPIGSDIEDGLSGYRFVNSSGEEVDDTWFTQYINKKEQITFNGETFKPDSKSVRAAVYRITRKYGEVVNVDINLDVQEKKLSERTSVVPRSYSQRWGMKLDVPAILHEYQAEYGENIISNLEIVEFDNKSKTPHGDGYTRGYYKFKIFFEDGSVSDEMSGDLYLQQHLAESINPTTVESAVLLNGAPRVGSLLNIANYKMELGAALKENLADTAIIANDSQEYSPQIEMEEAPDTAVAGHKSYKLKITYPDNSSEIFDGSILVFNPRPVVFRANQDLEESVDEQIKDGAYLEKMKKSSLEDAVKEVGLDFDTVGFEIEKIDRDNKEVYVKITFPNDASVNVSYQLEILSGDIVVKPQNELINPRTKELIVRTKEDVAVEQVFDMDAFKAEMRKAGYNADTATLNGTGKYSPKVEFVKKPDTKNGGEKEYTLKITYSDNTSEEFNGTVKVFAPRAIRYQVKEGQKELDKKDQQRLKELILEEALKEIDVNMDDVVFSVIAFEPEKSTIESEVVFKNGQRFTLVSGVKVVSGSEATKTFANDASLLPLNIEVFVGDKVYVEKLVDLKDYREKAQSSGLSDKYPDYEEDLLLSFVGSEPDTSAARTLNYTIYVLHVDFSTQKISGTITVKEKTAPDNSGNNQDDNQNKDQGNGGDNNSSNTDIVDVEEESTPLGTGENNDKSDNQQTTDAGKTEGTTETTTEVINLEEEGTPLGTAENAGETESSDNANGVGGEGLTITDLEEEQVALGAGTLPYTAQAGYTYFVALGGLLGALGLLLKKFSQKN